jgi:hypothetical protein
MPERLSELGQLRTAQRIVAHAEKSLEHCIDLNYVALLKDDWEDLVRALAVADTEPPATPDSSGSPVVSGEET